MELVNQETQVCGEIGMQAVIVQKTIASIGPCNADLAMCLMVPFESCHVYTFSAASARPLPPPRLSNS